MMIETLHSPRETVPGIVLVAMAHAADREAFFVGLADEGFAVEAMGSASELLRQLIASESHTAAPVAILLDEDLVRDTGKRSALLSAIEAHQGTLERVIPLVAANSRRERWFTATGATQPTQPRLARAGNLLSDLQRFTAVAAPASPTPTRESSEPWFSIRAASTQQEWDPSLYRAQLALFCESYRTFPERLAERIGEGPVAELGAELEQLAGTARSLGALPLAALAAELGQRLKTGGAVALAGRLSGLTRTIDATIVAVDRRFQSSVQAYPSPMGAPGRTAPELVRTAA